ncbi:YjbH domain-containing protein [Paracoccus homiensis]|uniref:Exopolysaccharide biosynthesis protein YbjH n=1 Tax=Paracoccus homiensis TaxID=364199 RepID=A0A1I0EBM2_9RHOB|nr:YjbH domain-containing protein [Paracoccus homiensis]SET42344.1 Exopolysaccharide biosynthesis protein YbjH [Paracoccus homiensis]
MRRSPLFRRLLATTLPAALVIGSVSSTAIADPLMARNMSTYGMPGGIDTPTAEALPDGTLGATVSYSDYARRTNVVFQALPRLTTALRYSKVDGINDYRNDGYILDRSFDLRFQALDEQGWRPAVAIGLQDFLGTGVYSGEYIVATKNVTPTIRASAGLGWGTLAGKPRVIDAGDQGGKPNVEDWFSGSPKPFASVAWQATEKLSLVAEYSHDEYIAQYNNGRVYQQGGKPDSSINLGAYYTFADNYEVGLYTIGTKKVGAQFSFALNPRQAPYPSGLEKSPAPVRPRPSPGADPEGWSGAWSQDPTAQPAIQTALGDALADEGQLLESMALSANRAEVRIRNTRYIQHAEAVGRTARLMTRALPPSVETFVITTSEDGVPTSSVTMRRSDVERLENTEAGRIAAASQLTDAVPYPAGLVRSEDVYPRFRWNIQPYLDLGIFSAEDRLGYETGAEARATYEIMPGLELTGAVRQRVIGNIDDRGPGIPGRRGEYYTPAEYEADPSLETTPEGVPRVRSDTRMYTGNTSPVIPEMTLAWYAKPAQNVYTRVTTGLLERAYGGVSAEVLWKPADSPFGFGAEINRVKKRDFDQLLSFRDYEVTMGHVSAYYEFSQGFTAQLDVGKYLAGDKGATLTLTREFANGWQIGAFATKTDLSDEEFGEGSFDKGVMLSIPLSWATGQPSRERATTTIRSLARDGGAQLNVKGRLYDRVRDSHSVKLYQGWGRFWR